MAEGPGQRRGRRTRSDAAWAGLVALLVSFTMVALAVKAPRPAAGVSGPWAHQATALALITEAILAVALAVLVVRGRRASARRQEGVSAAPDQAMAVAQRLRAVLRPLLSAALLLIAVMLVLSKIHAWPLPPRPLPRVLQSAPAQRFAPHRLGGPTGQHLQMGALRDVLIALALLAVLVAAAIIISHRRRPGPVPAQPAPAGPLPEDEEKLRDAVMAGRTALAVPDEAHAAVIACYLAMERSLAEAGTAPEVAGTPAELLARAAQAGLVHTDAASRLTTLFYEARFSSHPFGDAEREAAERALAQLHADLSARAPR